MNNNFFSNYMSKLKLEAILRSALAGMAIGFGANFVAATVTWFLPIKGFWLSLGIFALVSALSGLFFYFKVFRPTDLRNARRMDSLGLYERVVTMVEFEHDDSYIAKVQREDAQKALAAINKDDLKIKISKTVLTALIITTILGVSMTTVSALSDSGVMPGGDDILNEAIGDAFKVSYEVNYLIMDDKGGIIEGDEAQLVEEGSDAETVTAVADDGFVFKEWSDGTLTPTRTDKNITEDVTYYAIFTTLSEDGGLQEGDEGDVDPNAPKKDGQQNGQDNGNSPTGDPNDSLLGAGKNQPNNQIINGKTYYREVISEYKDSANERIFDEDSDLSDIEKEIIKKYFGIV